MDSVAQPTNVKNRGNRRYQSNRKAEEVTDRRPASAPGDPKRVADS